MKQADKELWAIARVAHEAVRAWQKANGQDSSPGWNQAPQWMKRASLDAVEWRIANPDAPTSAQHDRWMAEKIAAGWKYGPRKSGVKKTHPMITPYDDLPVVEKRKDALMASVIDALVGKL